MIGPEQYKASLYDKLWGIVILQENENILLKMMAAFMIAIAVVVHLLIINGFTVPYGKHSSTKWGFLINAKLAWFFMESWSFTIPVYLIFTSDETISTASIILIALFMVHYGNRVFIYPFKLNGGKPMPVLTMLMATAFTSYNGYMQTSYLLRHANYSEDWIFRPNFVAGVCLFITGMYINVKCDEILRNLRKPGSQGYKIPHGNMFDYVCCGNLFGECVEWSGWAMACWSLQALAFATFAVLMLSAKSYSTYLWYYKKFDNFPKNRKIFIPFIL